jgi:hypothetical protein
VVLELHLLGRPTALVDGELVRLRGTKAWALLGYLLRSDRSVARARLARVLFADAADPEGALRWNLSHLRRSLGVELDGDPLRLSLPADTWCDLQLLNSGDAQQAVELPGVDDGFLCGLRVAAADEFRWWLDGERRHLAKVLADVRREAALLCWVGVTPPAPSRLPSWSPPTIHSTSTPRRCWSAACTLPLVTRTPALWQLNGRGGSAMSSGWIRVM